MNDRSDTGSDRPAAIDRQPSASARIEAARIDGRQRVGVQPEAPGRLQCRLRAAARELWQASGVLHAMGQGDSAQALRLSDLGDEVAAMERALAVELYL